MTDSPLPDVAAASATGAIDGYRLKAVIAAGARAVETNRDEINALNVFPVPDGDTGTNMALTLRSVVDDANAATQDSAPGVAAVMARSALLGARGNSGLILAQFFKGLAVGLDGRQALGGRELASSLKAASDHAYGSMPNPREGTMLTVFREAGDAAARKAEATADLVPVWEAAAEQARDTVARTPTMLDVLREAGVVDSGGYGFMVLLEGGLACLRDQSDGALGIASPEAIGLDPGAEPGAGRIREEFLSSAEEEVWGYCTVFAIEGEGMDPVAVRSHIGTLGKSAVVAGDDRIIKVHVHPLDPGPALSYGASLGTLSNITIMNMDEQTREWAESRRGEKTRLNVAVVAVVAGDGLNALFVNTGLGACSIVPGGDTMNPSTRDLLDAVERAPADKVILLPNNKNVIGTAEQVPALTKKMVYVVPSATVPEGVAALLAFSPDQHMEANVSAMVEAAGSVRSGAICRAVRDSTMDGKQVSEGQVMGLLDGRLLCVGATAGDVLLEMMSGQDLSGQLVTLYAGDAVEQDEAESAAEALRQRFPDAEVEVVDGGQPYYDYFIAIE